MTACSDDSFLAPIEKGPDAQTTEQGIATPGGKEIHFITWNDGHGSLNKQTTTKKWIDKKDGGQIFMAAQNKSVRIDVDFKIPEKSINKSALVSMTLDDEVIDLVFGPSGATFDPPSILNIHVSGLDLSDVNPDLINIYYVDPNGNWEIMESEEVFVDVPSGTIIIRNALIHHFSRYAISKD
jgi:hypothetical protein